MLMQAHTKMQQSPALSLSLVKPYQLQLQTIQQSTSTTTTKGGKSQ